MIESSVFFDALKSAGVSFFAGVPDSLLKDFCAYVTDHAERHVITANEGSAVALAMGHHLATGGVGLVYLQNSGLGNTVNPLTSLADPLVYGVPLLLVVGWRGEPGDPDEPQHKQMGRVTLATLEALGISTTILPTEQAEAIVALEAAVAKAKADNAAVAIVIKKGTFAPYKLAAKDTNPYTMSREEAIEQAVLSLPKGACVVATTGMPSRELYEVREKRGEAHASDFLTVGGMGHASMIALGVAMERPERTVYCFDGDGAVLMHMGNLSTIAQIAPKNFKHVVLNNGAHDSVGGQPTVGFEVDICAVAKACGYASVTSASEPEKVREALAALAAAEGPALVEIRVKKGARKDLGRPKMSPQDLKVAFGGFVKG